MSPGLLIPVYSIRVKGVELTLKVTLGDRGNTVLLHLQLLESVQDGERLLRDAGQLVTTQVQPLQLPVTVKYANETV